MEELRWVPVRPWPTHPRADWFGAGCADASRGARSES